MKNPTHQQHKDLGKTLGELGLSEFSGLDCVIVPSGCVHENKPDTQVVRGEVEAHNVVGATCLSPIFNVPTITIGFSLTDSQASFTHVDDSGRILFAIANRYRPLHAVTVGLQSNIDIILVE